MVMMMMMMMMMVVMMMIKTIPNKVIGTETFLCFVQVAVSAVNRYLRALKKATNR